MDKEGYLAYLKSLGKKDHHTNRIQSLLDLEKELEIDLDDFIPYNGDYENIKKLHSIMKTEQLHKEALNFALNSYIRFKLDGDKKY